MPESTSYNSANGAQPPIEPAREPRVAPPPDAAAGIGAAYHTARHAIGKMGTSRALRTLLKVNQTDGFDCPSCAWPDPDRDRSITEFCENGAKAVASEATAARVTPDFFARHSITELQQQSDAWLDKQGRLTQPMLLKRGATHYEPITWDDAFAMIARELNALAGPDEAAFYTSGRTSNEAAFLYQLFVRQFGTNNLPDCSNMCHESSSFGLPQSIGIGKATVTLDDFAQADCIFLIGQNPGTCHPRMLIHLERAARRGCAIVSVNPLPELGTVRFRNPQDVHHLFDEGTPIASLFLPVRINGDVALLKGVMKAMLEAGAVDRAFVDAHTEGFDALARDLEIETWEAIVENGGVSQELIREAAQVAARSKRMIVCWAMGITQHANGVANVQTIANFALLNGHVGRPGAGLCPVRGHSNVQGDRTVGITSRPTDAFLDALGREFGFDPPREHGLDTVAAIRAMQEGQVKVFVGLGGNFLSAAPDTEFTAAAIRKCRLTVQISTKLNRGHLVTGEQALILPCLGRTERDVQKSGEQFVTVEDTVGKIHASRGVLPPASDHLLSEPTIVARMACAVLGSRARIDWQSLVENYDRIRDHVERVVPGFDDYNRRVREPGGFYLPNAPREGRFPTPSGRARFIVHPIPRHELRDDQLMLMTVRSHDQFNTTVYGEDDRYRGITGGRRVVFMNAHDVRRLGLSEGQWVDLVSHSESGTRRASHFKVVTYTIPPRCAAAYFPETNVLVPVNSVAVGSNQPASKSIVIAVEPERNGVT